MDCQREVGHEFRSGDQEKKRYYPVPVSAERMNTFRGDANVTKPTNSHAKPMVQPMVVSPRTERQSRMSGRENLCPRTRVVKMIKTAAVK